MTLPSPQADASTQADPTASSAARSATPGISPLAIAWSQPTVSPEHGVYVVLIVSFLTGAAAAQQWTLATAIAFLCAFSGFQSEHPLVLQIKQRRSWKPRFLIWGGLYGAIALGSAGYLYVQTPVLLWVYLGAIAALILDAILVFYRQQKSVVNELLTFAAVCLAAPLANLVVTETWTHSLVGLWLLNTLFFSSSIFTVKLRKPKTASLMPGMVYHAIATAILIGLWWMGWLIPIAAIGYGIVLLKWGVIWIWQDWYRRTPIHNVAMLETTSALIFLLIVTLSVLPAHWPG